MVKVTCQEGFRLSTNLVQGENKTKMKAKNKKKQEKKS